MPLEQLNISMPPKMAKFVRGKVQTGSYTDISEVVRSAIRRMQEDEEREVLSAQDSADNLLARLPSETHDSIAADVRAGLAAIERGEYTDYVGREGLDGLAKQIKERGRKLLSKSTSKR